MEIKEGNTYKMPALEKILGMDRHTISKLIKSGKLKSIGNVHARVTGYELMRYKGIKSWQE